MANTSLKVSSKFTGISQTFLLLLCHRISAFPNIKCLFYAAIVRDISVAVGVRLNNYVVFYFNSRYIFAVVYHAINVVLKELPVDKTIFQFFACPQKFHGVFQPSERISVYAAFQVGMSEIL